MKRKLMSFISILIVCALSLGTSNMNAYAAESKNLSVPIIMQGNNPWCWAASIASIVNYTTGSNLSAQNVVNAVGGTNDHGSIQNICKGYANYGFSCELKTRTLSYQEVKDSINAGKPIQALFINNSNEGHSVVISGYTDTGYGKYYSIMEPGAGTYNMISENNGSPYITYNNETFYWVYTYVSYKIK